MKRTCDTCKQMTDRRFIDSPGSKRWCKRHKCWMSPMRVCGFWCEKPSKRLF